MLFITLFMAIVWDVEFHEFVKPSETVAKGSIFNSFFIRDHKIIKGFESCDRVDHEVSVARSDTNRIFKQCYMHNFW